MTIYIKVIVLMSSYLTQNLSMMITFNTSSCLELNDVVCGQLNREGLLCSKCKAGFGPALYSLTWKCVKCDDEHSYQKWILFFFLKLTPLTVFYFIVIIFNVRATSSPFTAYILLKVCSSYCTFGNYNTLSHANPLSLSHQTHQEDHVLHLLQGPSFFPVLCGYLPRSLQRCNGTNGTRDYRAMVHNKRINNIPSYLVQSRHTNIIHEI